ncbi:hypothetical protein MLD38_005810 [Melastoma candidum]|uniref:Uncharacterized protein n=1 Tax=Melastoma candidum TaxID=119954 RepID=A0ACB9RKW5_9MYRT|nr:hypothetical protein MLD38_005810 [Melastoma candidum]
MTRKCSHCNMMGHNSRTCGSFRLGSVPLGTTTTTTASTTTGPGSVRLFGVLIGGTHSSLSTISKWVSLDCISAASAVSSSPSASSPHSTSRFFVEENAAFVDDFVSYGVLLPGSQDLIKKGVPWSEDEHKQFLLGLEKLGKGDWRGISKHFVHTRTPTQVASHAQKYFLRRASLDNKKRRSSLFDMVGGNDNDQSSKRHNRIPTDQHLSGRRKPSSSDQQLVGALRPLDLSLGSFSNNADHHSASSSSSLYPRHTSVDLDLTLGAPRPPRLPKSLSSFGAMRVS